MRKRVPARSFFAVSSFSIAANNVGTPKKMLGLYLFISENIKAGVGRSALSTRGGADRHRKCQRVAETIGEEQLCR